ncbi:hypothetical protein AXE65_01760 [Ventosimonas gracilis]|uniref:DUF3742 domain-containing protein n=1 Tax=Ventosimonas gracilis TaxID=1680762 RepID=A0A139SUR4_9GAMM|nr:DUF3742 family protein [Ventosimonas gracilis]KXU38317.1 hypothetical protein AXE65_01760 [Ventosimonas gracilis]
MNTTTRIRTAERFGRWLGRGWRGCVRGERRVSAWLVDKGAPVVVTATLVWVVKLAVLGVLLYVAFWIALLLLFMVGAGWAAAANTPEEEKWWPFTDLTELRKKSGYDPNLYNDASHELFIDDRQKFISVFRH